MRHGRQRRAPAVRLLVVLALVAGVLFALDGSAGRLPAAQAADLSLFQAGNIISDAVFFDPATMSPNDIQVFLSSRNPSCTNVAGWLPCLKNYTESTWTRAADGICDGSYYGATGESAATIIYKVAQACGINPRVLIVMLQKEQGLVLATGGSLNPANYPNRYRSAMGYGCPDTAVCDSQYYGFYNQVYGAAHQMQRYATYPTRYGYRAGAWNNILFNPSSSCGSSSVYIVNQATAGLYNYTPYQPDAAALAAGYGQGDGCSAYGNRNFFAYFTDWFGTTGAYTTSGAIGGYWTLAGGGTGYLGYPTGPVVCGMVGGGCGQHFQNGSVYWSPTGGAHGVSGAIRYAWAAQGWQAGTYAYPTDEMDCSLPSGGCRQHFQGGQILWTATTGARAVPTTVQQGWDAAGGLTGYLGYPTADLVCGLTRSGCRQDFQGGPVYWSPAAGAHTISGGIGAQWLGLGADASTLGYPTANMTCTTGGCAQRFESGQIGWTADTGNHVVDGAIGALWTGQGAGTGPLGYPVDNMACGLPGAGCGETFQQGAIYWSVGSGTHAISGALGTYWTGTGGTSSALGYPTSEMTCVASGCSQAFQYTYLAGSTALGFHNLQGAILAFWSGLGAGGGSLGIPTAEMTCSATGCSQSFQNGDAYWSAGTGTHSVSGAFATAWTARGGTAGALGYPTGEAVCGLTASGCRQAFQGGTLYTSPASGTHSTSGAVGAIWGWMGAELSPIGYPTSDLTCTSGGCAQQFQTGALGWTAPSGVRLTNGGIGALWTAQGGATGALGYPVDDQVCGLTSSGCRQNFQNGAVYWSPYGGAHAVFGAIAGFWWGTGNERGSLGYPVSDMTCAAAGCSQQFLNGTVVWSVPGGTHLLGGGIGGLWSQQGGLAAPVGMPTTEQSCTPSGCSQTFTGGVIVWSAATGAHAVSGPIRTAWNAAGGSAGSLGYPTAEATPVTGGTVQTFQGGRLTLDTASGTVTRS